MRHEAFVLVALAACWGEHPSNVAATGPASAPRAAYHRPAVRDPRPQPEEVTFGYGRGRSFVATSTIPLTPGVSYTWRIRLPCTASVRYRETLALPAPTTWSAPSSEISADGSIAITSDDAPCNDGWIEHAWFVNSDDPPGEYEITVEIDGYATQRFRATFTP